MGRSGFAFSYAVTSPESSVQHRASSVFGHGDGHGNGVSPAGSQRRRPVLPPGIRREKLLLPRAKDALYRSFGYFKRIAVFALRYQRSATMSEQTVRAEVGQLTADSQRLTTPQTIDCDSSARFIVVPISAGVSATAMPAASRAAILSAAVPLPPEMMAPAWPMRRPGGAV